MSKYRALVVGTLLSILVAGYGVNDYFSARNSSIAKYREIRKEIKDLEAQRERLINLDNYQSYKIKNIDLQLEDLEDSREAIALGCDMNQRDLAKEKLLAKLGF